MGNDPKTSVVDKFHRAHDVPNLFIVDGSNLVTGGRNHPTMTIQALAYRAAEHLIKAAKSGQSDHAGVRTMNRRSGGQEKFFSKKNLLISDSDFAPAVLPDSPFVTSPTPCNSAAPRSQFDDRYQSTRLCSCQRTGGGCCGGDRRARSCAGSCCKDWLRKARGHRIRQRQSVQERRRSNVCRRGLSTSRQRIRSPRRRDRRRQYRGARSGRHERGLWWPAER